MRDAKAVALGFFAELNANGIGWARRFGTDNIRWWVSGMGDLSKEKFLSVVGIIERQVAEPLKFTVHDIMAEDDHVAAEVEVSAPLKSGTYYHNHYCFKFIVRDDEIYQVREYLDPRPVAEAFELDV
jgi:ketosteroid isomerase-like protein